MHDTAKSSRYDQDIRVGARKVPKIGVSSNGRPNPLCGAGRGVRRFTDMLDASPVSNVRLTALLSAKAPWDNLPGIICATMISLLCYTNRGPAMKRAPQTNSQRRKERARVRGSIKLNEVMIIAEREGLLRGQRTEVVRGRMPEALVARAKKRTGINSNTDLIEVALANIAVEDDYADWLLSRRGTVSLEADLEF
jgi:hypothetical protein